jgi:adenylate kinase family enzyme
VPAAQRILIYGVTGSGKSTLAAAISDRTGIPWHCVDDFTWQPGWRSTPDDEQRRIAESICAGDRWILDTAYGSWRDVPLARTDLVVALDYPRWLSLTRLVRRSIGRAADRRPICNGNTESWRQLFSRESIVAWHFRSFTSKQQQIREWAAGAVEPPVLRLTSPRATQAWLDTLGPT